MPVEPLVGSVQGVAEPPQLLAHGLGCGVLLLRGLEVGVQTFVDFVVGEGLLHWVVRVVVAEDVGVRTLSGVGLVGYFDD